MPEATATEESQRASSAERVVQVLGFAVLAGILIWAARHLDGRALWSAIRSSNVALLVLAAVVNVGVIALQGWRWRILLEPLGETSYRVAAGALTVSFATSSVVPARAGELVRVHLVAKRMGIGRAAVAGTLVLDHVVNGISIIPLLVVLPFLGPIPDWIRRGVPIVLGVVSFGAIVAWFGAGSAPTSNTFFGRVRRGLASVRHPRQMARAAAVAALAWLGEVLVLWLCLRAFTPQYGLAVALITLVAVNIAIAVPSPPGNFGTLEVGAVLVLVAFGMEREQAVAFALAYHVAQMVSVWCAFPVGWWWARHAPARPTPPGADPGWPSIEKPPAQA